MARLSAIACLMLSLGSVLAQESDPNQEQGRVAENVILVTMDGFRWQELFGGADRRLMTKEAGKVNEPEQLRARFHREDPNDRRQALMPFFWNTIATNGQVLGDPDQDSKVSVTNDQQFSYPGYNELLSGFADPTVTSNDKVNNTNTTVLEWLHQKPKYQNRVAVFASWDVFPYIVNTQRSGIPVNAGWQPLSEDVARHRHVNALTRQLPRYWSSVRYDAITFQGALSCLRDKQPRVLYVALGETDDWAHDGRYDLYLEAAYNNDQFIRELWETAQTLPQYRAKTTLILTSDHGRGDGREGWKNHNAETPGSDRIWIALLGPSIRPAGIVAGAQATQSQIAATVAAALGEDFQKHDPRIAPPLKALKAKR